MKTSGFRDYFKNKYFCFFSIISTIVVSRLIHYFLNTYYSNYLIARIVMRFLAPFPQISIFWAISIICVASTFLIFICYLGKKDSNYKLKSKQ